MFRSPLRPAGGAGEIRVEHPDDDELAPSCFCSRRSRYAASPAAPADAFISATTLGVLWDWRGHGLLPFVTDGVSEAQ